MFFICSVFSLLFVIGVFFFFQFFFNNSFFCFINIFFLFFFLLLIHILIYILLFYQVNIQCFLCTFIDIGLLRLQWFFALDILSCILLYVVVFIAIFVNFYSIDYMGLDPHFLRYICYLAFFCLFMVLLIISIDFIQFFIGWEGVGLCSYLLISFWSTRLQASKAAIKAMLTNRIGDFGLMVGFVCLFGINKNLSFNVIFLSNFFIKFFFFNFFNSFDINILSFCCFFLFIGAVGKSAQVGLHVWLPDAMEGPTPVSALIHAATMVTAGIFLIIRCSSLFELCPFVLFFVTIIGALTAFFAGSVGIVQNDLKRIIAFSTCSQLGYMVCSCGLSGYFIGFFHLFNHAFFKALLFLCAGCIIHILNDEQDLRKMGGLLYILPFTYIIFFIGSLTLLGFPFLSGFYSKDILLEFAFSCYSFSGFFVFWLGSIAAFFTAFYSFRLLLLTFYVRVNVCYFVFKGISEVSFFLGLPLFCLCFCSIFCGFIFKDLFCGLGTDMLYSSIFVLYCNCMLLDFEFIPMFFKVLPLIFSGCGVFFIFLLYFLVKKNIYFFFNCHIFIYYSYFFLNRKWFFDKIYNEFINQYFFIFSYFLFFCKIDRGILEYLGSCKIAFNIFNLSYYFSFFYSFSFFDFLILFYIYIYLFIIIFFFFQFFFDFLFIFFFFFLFLIIL